MRYLFLALMPVSVWASPDLPDMEMHIFSQDTAVLLQNESPRMVVYPETEHTVAAEPDEQTLYLHYPDKKQIDVYTEPVATENVTDNDSGYEMEIYLDAGYRQDNIDWNIADPSGTPDILSELSWKNLDIAVFEAGSHLTFPSRWVIDGRFAYGTIVDGQNQDSDYHGNNRTQEFSRSNNLADDGNTLDASLALGYRLPLVPSSKGRPYWSVTPEAGFSYHAQNLKMRRGFQTIPATGNFAGLDSGYDASWYGPWGGLSTEINIVDRVFLTGSFEYHYAFYQGVGHWNLITDFQQPDSFEHKAEGTGIVASLGGKVKLMNDLSLRFSVDYQNWKANQKGVDITHFSDGTDGETNLNKVNWKSLGANIGLNYAF